MNAAVHKSHRDAVPFGDLAPRFAVSIDEHKSAIDVLLKRCSPAAIVWMVIAICIVALNGKRIGVSVGKCPFAKFWKRLPRVADRNSSAAVITEASGFGVCAAIPHAFPDAVQACSRSSVRSQIRLACSGFRTYTRGALAGSEVASCRRPCPAAVAYTAPNGCTSTGIS